ncbi:MAG: imidazoleglycerol-phosphate dehydratase HisB [Vulcanimicrobiaceae bacterium]
MNGPVARHARIERATNETRIDLELDLDGGPLAVDSSLRFFDHMLVSLATHAGLGLRLEARGDGLDGHHLVEDVGIALGTALAQALGSKRGIARFGSCAIPLDDALVLASVDLSGRAYFNGQLRFGAENLGDLKTELVPHFFRSTADNGRFNLHLIQLAGSDSHHVCEAAFKAFARALSQAKAPSGSSEIPSTKGLLA